MPMQYTEIFSAVKIENFIGKNFVAVNIQCGYNVSTHNECFGATIRKLGIPLQTPVFLYKSGVYGGIHFTDMFS